MGTNRPDIYINPSGDTTTTNPQPSGLPAFYKDLREWGSITANTSDKQPIIQQAINDCIANGYRRLYVPTIGQYYTHAPIIVAQVYKGNYVGFTLEIFGDGDMWDAGFASFINAQFSDSFIVGIQHGKGCTLRGLSFSGQFVVPHGMSDYDYYRIPFDSYTDGVSRDTRYSPNAAIVIDPFTRGGIPTDGGYPGLSSWYQGTGGQQGSTATTIDNCTVDKTVVGICSSPNGSTRNAEITSIRNVRVGNHKLCISGGQDQEKTNSVYNIAAWSNAHTVFATGKYGAGTAGHWIIDRVNLAGKIVEFINNDQQGYFPTTVSNVYAEALGRWGYMQNNKGQNATVKDCIIGFTYPETAGLQSLISGDNTTYEGCTFRYYGKAGLAMLIQGESTFNDCNFSGHPLFTGQYWYPRFVNCKASGAFLGLTGTKTFGGGNRVHPYGNWTLDFYNTDYEVLMGDDRGFRGQVKSNSAQDIYTSIASDNVVMVTVNGMSLSFTSADSSIYFGNCLIKIGNYFAVVTGISSNIVTASYNDPQMPSAVYNIISYHPVWFTGSFIGDITSGQNTITNCRDDYFSSNHGVGNFVGIVFKNPYGGSRHIRITGVSGTTLTFYGSITATKTGAIFGNYGSKEIYTEYPTTNAFLAGYIVRRGDKVITQKGGENSIEYIVEKGGFLQGDADTRKATLAQTSGTWTGTQAQYDAITNPSDDIIYYITNTAP